MGYRLLLLLGAAHVVLAQYSGPAILSRGEAPGSISLPAIRFRPYVDVSGIYSTGLAGVIVSDTGELASTASAGVRLAFGISGHQRWRRTNLSVDYRGSVSHYLRRTYYDGMSQSILLGLRHNINRRMTLNLSQTAGMFTRDFGLLGVSQTALYDPSTAYIPTTDYFDNRTIYFTSVGNLVMQKTARLSFMAGGFAVKNSRRSEALRSANGVGATGDVQYRLTRRSTIGGNYQYNRIHHERTTGGADVHSAGFTYAIGLSLRTELSAYAGATHIESKSQITTQTDPVIAALLGIRETSQIVHYLAWTPNFGVRISRRVPQGILTAAVTHGVSPGNGLFMTSKTLTVNAGYSYLGLRRWSASIQGSYYSSNAVVGATGSYGSASGGLRLSRKIGRSLHFIATHNVRQYDSATFARYRRLINELSLGLAFTPGELPLRVW
jgi:hypothetical protein